MYPGLLYEPVDALLNVHVAYMRRLISQGCIQPYVVLLYTYIRSSALNRMEVTANRIGPGNQALVWQFVNRNYVLCILLLYSANYVSVTVRMTAD